MLMNRRPLNGQIEFLVLTRWRSIDAFEAFAGGDIGGTVVEPGGWPHWWNSISARLCTV
jgi:hypothetical protein